MKKTNHPLAMKRRGFIKKAVSVGSLMILPSNVLFAKKEVKDTSGKIVQKAVVLPNDKVNMACCGIGNRGASVVRDLHATGAD